MDKLEAIKKLCWLIDAFESNGNEKYILNAIKRVVFSDYLGESESVEQIVSEAERLANAIDDFEGVGPL